MQGLELSRRFYFEAVRPILEREFPEVEHAAALIGHGSEVLRFDDERFRDHQWGPRVQLFMRDLGYADEIARTMANMLPRRVAGFPTNFGPTDEEGTVVLAELETGPINHGVETIVLAEYLRAELGVDPLEGFTITIGLRRPPSASSSRLPATCSSTRSATSPACASSWLGTRTTSGYS